MREVYARLSVRRTGNPQPRATPWVGGIRRRFPVRRTESRWPIERLSVLRTEYGELARSTQGVALGLGLPVLRTENGLLANAAGVDREVQLPLDALGVP